MNLINCSVKLFALSSLLCASPIFAETSDKLRLSLIGGITLGGDKIGTLGYFDGSTKNLYAGRFAYIGGGLEYEINEDYTVQINAQYHWDTATAVNGDVEFSRYEFEAIPYYHLNDQYRVGLGLGLHTNTKLSSDFSADVGYDNANAIIASVGRKMKDSDRWLEFRIVSVEYFINKYNNYQLPSSFIFEPYDGSHIGLSYHMLF